MKRRVAIFLGVLEIIVAISAIPAGISMLIDPSGHSLGLSTDILRSSPFNDFFIPGLLLLIFNGIFYVTGSVFSFTNHRFSGQIGFVLGIILIGWIVIQVGFVGLTNVLQPLFMFIGAIVVLLSFLLIRNTRPNIPI